MQLPAHVQRGFRQDMFILCVPHSLRLQVITLCDIECTDHGDWAGYIRSVFHSFNLYTFIHGPERFVYHLTTGLCLTLRLGFKNATRTTTQTVIRATSIVLATSDQRLRGMRTCCTLQHSKCVSRSVSVLRVVAWNWDDCLKMSSEIACTCEVSCM